MAMIAHAATLEARVPFMHFFDGFRTSHEVNKIEQLLVEDMRAMIDDRTGAGAPGAWPFPRSSCAAGNGPEPGRLFPGTGDRQSVIIWHCPEIVQKTMDKFAKSGWRAYRHLFDYVGAPDAERVMVMMGSGAETAGETAEYLVNQHGEKVGVFKVHLYRPFLCCHFIEALPKYGKQIAVLDRTKEPGSTGEPLYQDVITAIAESGLGAHAASDRGPLWSFIEGVHSSDDQGCF